jgi:anti-anti-sigma factor
LEIRPGADPSVIRISGEIDLSNVQELERALDRAISERDAVAVHVWEVSFMGLEGARVLVQAARRLPEHGHLYVVGPSAALMRTMEILEASRVRQLVLLPEC